LVGAWSLRSIGRLGGQETEVTHYIAIVEDEDGKATGVWFPDLPGCFSAGDKLDDALMNAQEAFALYAKSMSKNGRALPQPRSLSELRADPEVADDLRDYMVALIPFDPSVLRPAAE
jgi:predicted RNase H-like HicB family nuclease